jgi:D-beta-D-heptose 7-phosphate kinase/D-beta-D-heptose 1-phosphate adenosyltransferase
MIEQLHKLISQIENNWASKRVLVVGDVMLDKYVFGQVRRISPEAPVPVVCAAYRSHQPGGAGNVAMNLARLGAAAHVVAFAGQDECGDLLAECLRANRISHEFVASTAFPTVTKERILSGHQQMLRVDTERLDPRPKGDYDRLAALALARVLECDAVVLSDYGKGALTPDVCQQIVQAARSRGIPVLVDPKSSDFTRYKGATTICPNLAELAAVVHIGAQDTNVILDAAQGMLDGLNIEFMTATLSEKGIALIYPSERFLAPAVARQVFDVSGAGDAVIAVLALSLTSGLNPRDAVELANLAAGVVVGKVGTVPVEKHELLAALSSEITLHAEDKIVVGEDLLRRIANWKANGERVVFTNGCFDLLHIGHITLLEEARRFGDRLIVAINSDASVRALKGSGRPIVGESERARVLAALGAVDAVAVFNEPTPLQLILATRPDVVVKGGDYEVASVVGAQEVLSWGGQVKIVPIVEGFSTSGLIAKGNLTSSKSG